MSEMSDDDFMTDPMSDEDADMEYGDDDDTGEEDFSDAYDNDGNDDEPFDDKDDKPQKKAYEVDFKVLSDAEIQSSQDSQIKEVSNILGLTHDSAAVLLRYFKWNKERLIEQYMDNSETILDDAGVDAMSADRPPPRSKTVRGFACDICCEDGKGLETFALKCEHRYCLVCYGHYVMQKIKDEGESGRIQCPADKCKVVIDSRSVAFLANEATIARYKELLNRTYVDDKENLRWCPAPNCEYVVDCAIKQRQLNEIVPSVTCLCGNQFCFGCGLAEHQPCPCGLVKKWLKKCEDDSETANWISANTKECPKCISTIEKNGGCNHMTCRKCKHEFCWVCMGPWQEHGSSWYNCNRYEEKAGIDARDTQAKSRQSLERYLHYYNRYANHEQSAKLDKDLYIKTEKKMQNLQTQSGMSWIEVQYLDAASKVLQQCRQTLKWTYAFAFYLQRNNMTTIFEDNQKDLEMSVEQLSELFEKPTDKLSEIKVEMLDKTAYVSSRRIILLDTTAQGLQDGTWEFAVET